MSDAGGATADREKTGGWFARLKSGLSRSTASLGEGITSILSRGKLDQETLDALEDHLIAADLGIATAAAVTGKLAAERFDKSISDAEVRSALAEHIVAILEPVARPLAIDPAHKPHVILVAGVNGTGKTTTIGKLANQLHAQGHSIVLAAADTFRAAAIDQLKIWGERAGVAVVAGEVGGDAAGLAFAALEKAQAEGADLLMVDTAGRLQNKADLMDELVKVVRVLRKLDPSAPHDSLLVLDATTGQNAISQVATFKDQCGISGLIMTKLDGTARGGVLVAIAERFGLPIHAIGIGEKIADLRRFDARAFAEALTGVEGG